MKYRITLRIIELVEEMNTYKDQMETVSKSSTIYEQTDEKETIDLKAIFEAFNK